MSMTSKHVQTILNGAIYTLKQIIPMNINIQSPSFLTEPFTHKEIGVLVGLTGDIKGRVILDSTSAIFSAIGNENVRHEFRRRNVEIIYRGIR
ncbi:hypothetical protein [Ureibacillus thermosphaericus]|uniref:hypothetical protein n=2 Tax=Ureibacillus TaxID=160795 RepID=UPI00031306EB|nr:hypothetical protein [Ureibacillus thermosphaericus]